MGSKKGLITLEGFVVKNGHWTSENPGILNHVIRGLLNPNYCGHFLYLSHYKRFKKFL